MRVLVLLIAMLTPSLGLAHGQTPGFQVVKPSTLAHPEVYTIQNHYNFPITLAIAVYNKDGTPAEGWRTKDRKYTWNLLPNSSKEITIEFKAVNVRKLLVCSKLIGVGYEQEKPSVESNVCSRLIIDGFRR
jgi:hypothetical protein